MNMQTFPFLVLCVFVIKSTFGQENETGGNQFNGGNNSSDRVQIMTDSKVEEINPAKNQTSVDKVNNDGPYFIYPSYAELFKKEKYFGGIINCTNETSIAVLQVRASDTSKDRATSMEFSIVNTTKWANYFRIDSLTGLIKTASSLSKMPVERPIILNVQVQDGPTTEPDNLATTQVVVNEISDEDQVILLLCGLDQKEAVRHLSTIVTAIERTTYLIVGVESIIVPPKNSSKNVTSALCVYFIDPYNETVLPRNSVKIENDVLSKDGLYNLTVALRKEVSNISTVLTSLTPASCRQNTSGLSDPVTHQWNLFAILIIAIAALIGILGIAAMILICILWSRYKAQKERLVKAYVIPRYDPVLFVEPNRKQYETQVLKMNVPLDDSDSGNDLQLDLSNRNHTFNLGNVSYITRERPNAGSTSSSEESTAAHSSNRPYNNNRKHGHINHSYLRSEDDLGPGSASLTNENVTFREKKDYSHLGFNYLKNRPVDSITIL